MFIFPILYISSFFYSLFKLSKDKTQGILIFFIFGLPLYTISLSVALMEGYGAYVRVLQSFKEVCTLCYLAYLVFTISKKMVLNPIDKLMIAFFCYVLIYVFVPLGSYGFFQRVLAFKSLCFFPVVYFTGRMMSAEKINLSEIFHYIGLLSMAAACILCFEVITYTHLQTYTGYADYNYYFFEQPPGGNYGLSWTFEIENGMKRFASFFSTPLEYASATLIAVSALAALVTDNRNKIRLTNFAALAVLSSLFGIIFALSRASFVSYFLIIYFYALVTGNILIRQIFHYLGIAAVVIFLFFSINGDFFEFVLNTLQFTNGSSLGHLLEWLNGIQSMIAHPLGIGLGESGRVSAYVGLNTGGENQFVIIGVQAGVIALLLYVIIYVKMVAVAFKTVKERKGKIRKLAMFILLIKIGLIIPLFTAEVESDIYVSYLVWFLSGYFINMLSEKFPAGSRVTAANGLAYA